MNVSSVAVATEKPPDPADVTIAYLIKSDRWCFWETEYPEDMVMGPFDTEELCRLGVEDFYKHNNPFTSGKTDYVITHVARKQASWSEKG